MGSPASVWFFYDSGAVGKFLGIATLTEFQNFMRHGSPNNFGKLARDLLKLSGLLELELWELDYILGALGT